eukprot:59117-Prorocentrum_minimum.AAC.2
MSFQAGIRTAKCITLLTGAPNNLDPLLMDQNMVLTASVIESQQHHDDIRKELTGDLTGELSSRVRRAS